MSRLDSQFVVIKLAQMVNKLPRVDRHGHLCLYRFADTYLVGHDVIRVHRDYYEVTAGSHSAVRYALDPVTFNYFGSAVAYSVARQRNILELVQRIPVLDQQTAGAKFDLDNIRRLESPANQAIRSARIGEYKQNLLASQAELAHAVAAALSRL